MPIKNQQSESDMEQQTGSKLGKEYVKAVYYHPAYLQTPFRGPPHGPRQSPPNTSASAADRCETCSVKPGLKSSDRCEKGCGAQKAGGRGQEDVKGNCEGGWGKPSSWGTALGLEGAPGPGGACARVFGAQSPPKLSEAPPICACRTAWSYGDLHPACQGLGSAGTEG